LDAATIPSRVSVQIERMGTPPEESPDAAGT
jgi:hypothetical protein